MHEYSFLLCRTHKLLDLAWKVWKCFQHLLTIKRKKKKWGSKKIWFIQQQICILIKRIIWSYTVSAWKQVGQLFNSMWLLEKKIRLLCRVLACVALWLCLFTRGGNLLIKLWGKVTFMGFFFNSNFLFQEALD